MVSQKKLDTVKQVSAELKECDVIGILDMHKLPARQLHDIRNKLRGKARILMIKKKLFKFIFKEIGKKDIDKLLDFIQGEPALLLSKENPFKIANVIMQSKSKAKAKPGDIAPEKIIIKAGPTPLPPGPAIGDLQRMKIPAMVQGDKIHVREDTVVAKEGDEINSDIAGLLGKLNIEPMEIGLNLVAVWEKSIIYGKDVLFIPPEKYLDDILQGHAKAFNLAFSIGYYTKDNVPMFLSKAQSEAKALAKAANIITKDTVGEVLGNAKSHAEELKKHVKEPAKEESKEAPKEEPVADKTKTEDAPKTEEEPKEKPKQKTAEEKKE
jgi:large subunit ribosomal protein L10